MTIPSRRAAAMRHLWHPVFPLLLSLLLPVPGRTAPQFSGDVVSEHVRLRVPVERGWIGRDAIGDLERCWQFINRALQGNLPRRLLVVTDWEQSNSWSHAEGATLSIGMNDPAAVPSAKTYLLHQAARQMARLSLLELSQGGAGRQDNAYLLEGMAEIYALDFRGSARGLDASWVLSHYLDRAEPLNLARLSSWSAYSQGRSDLCVSAPAITFLLTCRQLHGREKLLKLFEEMRPDRPGDAFLRAFRSTAASLEKAWLSSVREYDASREVTVTTEEDAPVLKRAALVPLLTPGAGASLQLRLFIEDASANLLACGIFVAASAPGVVLQAQAGADGGHSYHYVAVPPGEEAAWRAQELRAIAVDASGNVRNWPVSDS